MYGHGLAVILTTVPREDYSMRCGMACQANKHMTLETTDHCRVRDHLREDHLSPARRTTHRPHAYGTIHPSPEYKHWPPGGAVIGYAVDMFANRVPAGTEQTGICARGNGCSGPMIVIVLPNRTCTPGRVRW